LKQPRRPAPRPGAEADYVSSAEALGVLAVKPQTLYSYVSRGLVRRIPVAGRGSLYHKADIERLRARSTARSGHGAVAGAALHWGEPVLVTGITEITSQGPRYRDHLATDLARRGCGAEAVADYLWTSGPLDPPLRWTFDKGLGKLGAKVAALVEVQPRMQPHQLLTEIVLLLGLEEGDPYAERSLRPARRIVQALTMGFGFLGPARKFVAPERQETLASYALRAAGAKATPEAVRLLNAAFVVLADHEFSAPTFAARIAASSRAGLHYCVGAALNVMFGSALGVRCDRIEEALLAADRSALRAKLGEPQPSPPLGFSQPVYRNGDPRAELIIELSLGLTVNRKKSRQAIETLRLEADRQNMVALDVAVVVLCRALGLDGMMASPLIAIARSAGWIAHVLEQYRQSFMIRPRGKFVPPSAQGG
jgi:citrate synthase